MVRHPPSHASLLELMSGCLATGLIACGAPALPARAASPPPACSEAHPSVVPPHQVGSSDDALSPAGRARLPSELGELLNDLRKLDAHFREAPENRERTALELAMTYDDLEARAHLDYLASCERAGEGKPCDAALRDLRRTARDSAERWCRYSEARFGGPHACRKTVPPRGATIDMDGEDEPASAGPKPSRPLQTPVPQTLPVPPCVAVIPAQCPAGQVGTVAGCLSETQVARIDVNSIPSSDVYVNGCWIGTTPRRGVPVPAGNVEIAFETERARTHRVVQVRPGETKTVAVKVQ